jgi:hypothetical protein
MDNPSTNAAQSSVIGRELVFSMTSMKFTVLDTSLMSKMFLKGAIELFENQERVNPHPLFLK